MLASIVVVVGGGVAPASATPLGVSGVAVGYQMHCALLDNGSVKCWPGPAVGDDVAAIDFGAGRTATEIAAGYLHACAVLDNGSVRCVGDDTYGQTGRPNDFTPLADTAWPAVDLGPGRTATAIAAGQYHTCAVLDNGSVKCWGGNNIGQLGLGDTANRGDNAGEMGNSLPAVSLGTGRTAVAISAGDSSTCAILDNASVKCWGENGVGQLGLGDTANRGDNAGEMGNSLPAVSLGTGLTANKISVGSHHACVVLSDDSVKCWGYNAVGGLGYGGLSFGAYVGDTAGEMGDALPAVDLGTGSTAKEIAASGTSICAILIDDTTKCWGTNTFGQLGLGDTNSRGDNSQAEMGDNLPVVDLGTGRTAVGLSTGVGSDTCAALDNSTLKCWGYNGNGQLGLGDGNNRGDNAGEMGDSLPAIDFGIGKPSAPSSDSVFATPGNKQVTVTWTAPRPGTSPITNSFVSVFDDLGNAPTGVTGATTRAVGSAATTFVFTGLTNGTVYSFKVAASNANGTGSQSQTSVNVARPVAAAVVVAGQSHSCALGGDGTVRCWGRNQAGQLGDGSTTNRTSSVPVSGLSGVTAVAVGGSHTCAIVALGKVKCWGSNASGQLGDNTLTNRKTPVLVQGVAEATALSAGASHTCALLGGEFLSDRKVKCWGLNTSGQGGNNTLTNKKIATFVTGLSSVQAISAGGNHTCARLYSGAVKCWGRNAKGQLGNNTLTNAKVPTAVPGLSAVAVSAGAQHTCAILNSGAVKCWGLNSSGQLGNNTTTNKKVPAAVPGLSFIGAISAGGSHTCALLNNSTVKCWGLNSSGQLGNNTTTNKKVPTAVAGLTGVVAIGAGGAHTTARLFPTGGLRSWGLNTYGQLGSGNTTRRLTPGVVSGLS